MQQILSPWKRIFKHLTEVGGYTVYAPGIYNGECVKRYIVVKQNGGSQILRLSSSRVTFNLILYLPRTEIDEFDEYVEDVKRVMRKLRPYVMPTYFEKPMVYDDRAKSHFISIEYRVNKKNI